MTNINGSTAHIGIQRWQYILLVLLVVLTFIAALSAEPTLDPAPITLLPTDGGNLTLIDALSPEIQAITLSFAKSEAKLKAEELNPEFDEATEPIRCLVRLETPAHNWFCGRFTNLPLDCDVEIVLCMIGNNTKGNIASVSKWKGLQPVLTYADPEQYDTYEWFTKDVQGRWMSGDPFKTAEVKYAGDGKLPDESSIPKELAASSLSPDGQFWSAWQDITTATVDVKTNTFRIRFRPLAKTACISMRIPYTYTYLQQFIEKLQAAKLPGVFIDNLGLTPEKRKLQVIRVEATDSTIKSDDKQTVLMIAREHATEHASSWALQGVLDAAISSRDNTKLSWLFIPIEDIDGSVHSIFDRITERFTSPDDPALPPEVLHYATFLVDYVDHHQTIDPSVSLHNVEANEAPNVSCPFRDARYPEQISSLNKDLFAALTQDKFIVESREPSGIQGWMNFRLYGWCALQFGTLDLTYEVNDRYPNHRLDSRQMIDIGYILFQQFSQWASNDGGRKQHLQAFARLAQRQEQRTAYFQRLHCKPESKKLFDLLVHGY